MEPLQNLRVLYAYDNKVSDEGAKYLYENKKNIVYTSLRQN